jgi:hypothetical protein
MVQRKFCSRIMSVSIMLWNFCVNCSKWQQCNVVRTRELQLPALSA